MAAPADPNHMQINAAGTPNVLFLGIQDIGADPAQIGRFGRGADEDGPTFIGACFLPVAGVGGQFRLQFVLLDQAAGGYVGGSKLAAQQAEQLLNHEKRVALRMQRAGLGIGAGQADIFIQIEAADFGGIQPPGIAGLGQVLVSAGGGAAGGQAQYRGAAGGQRSRQTLFNKLGRHLAQVVVIAGNEDGVHHRQFNICGLIARKGALWAAGMQSVFLGKGVLASPPRAEYKNWIVLFRQPERRGGRVAKAMEQLLALQACDQEIRRLRKEEADIPLRKQQIEARLNAHQEGLAQAERALLEARTRIKQLEAETEAGHQQIQKFRDQQLQIKTNDGYKALEKEIATTQQKIRGLEDQTLTTMEAMEEAQGVVQTRREALAKEQERVAQEIQALEARRGAIADDLQRAEAERITKAADIAPDWLARYERIFAKQHDAAIALVERGTCGGCHMKLSPAQILDARKPDTLTLCVHCSRLLYLAP